MSDNSSPSSGGATPALDWKFFQVFGSTNVEEVAEVDIVSAIEFDETGDYFAAGDKGGRVVIFERSQQVTRGKRSCEYKYYYEFQSHEPEFDYLKSLEIEEKINKIRWCKAKTNAHMLLTTNDKTIKLWKVSKKKVKTVSSFNLPKGTPTHAVPPISSVHLPAISSRGETTLLATPRRIFSNAHAYHVNSISHASDGETFISADDLRINLWNLGISNQSFNVVDIKPTNMEELTEVITSAEFHPHHCHIFIYSSSKGTIKLADMRQSALCDSSAKVFEETETIGGKSFFSEIISSISDVKFSRDGRYILSRDYMTLKLWDVNMDSKPVKVFQVHEHLRPKLCDLYESDHIFDKFECCSNSDGSMILTGSYGNVFHIYDTKTKADTQLEAAQRPARTHRSGDAQDYHKKILHLAWHPTENLIAAGARSTIFLFSA